MSVLAQRSPFFGAALRQCDEHESKLLQLHNREKREVPARGGQAGHTRSSPATRSGSGGGRITPAPSSSSSS